MSELLFAESQLGRYHTLNNDRWLAEPSVSLFAVADSECDEGLAGDTVVNALSHASQALGRLSAPAVHLVHALLVDALKQAHHALFDASHTGSAAVTAIACARDALIVAHVGDCRLYVREASGWVRRTRDQTLLEQNIEAGIAPEDGDARLQERSIITNVLGVGPQLRVDAEIVPMSGTTEILLCTRGAWMPLDPSGSAPPLPGALDAEHIGPFVFGRYREDGEQDNATVLVVRLELV